MHFTIIIIIIIINAIFYLYSAIRLQTQYIKRFVFVCVRCRYDKRGAEKFDDKEQAAAFAPSLGLGISKLFTVLVTVKTSQS